MGGATVTFDAAVGREALGRGSVSTAHLVSRVSATGASVEGGERPPLSVVFVLDVSGSMSGPPLEHVVGSVETLVGLLRDDDQVGVVAFSNRATEVAPVSRLTLSARQLIQRRVRRLRAGGRTFLEDGVARAAAMLPKRGAHERHAILVLTDGAPNVGAVTPEELSARVRSHRPEVSVSTLGFGEHHNEDVMVAMAQAGGGQYYFIPDPQVCGFEFARALGAQGDVVLDGVEVVLSPEDGVEVSRVLGGMPTRVSSAGLVVQLPDLLDGAEQLLVAELRVRAQDASGEMPLVRCTLRYRDAAQERHEERALDVRVGVRAAPGALVPEVWAKVLLAQTDGVRARAREMADRGQFDGAAAMLRRMIGEIEASPGFVAGDGSALAEACELLVDEAMAMERKPNVEDYKSFKRHSMSVSLVSGGAQVSEGEGRTEASRAMMGAVYGEVPEADLEVMDGRLAGQRLSLGPDQIIGRTPSADLVIAHPSVSRRHSRIVALEGGFHVVDLGSTNTTLLNGARLKDTRGLQDGDVVQVGDVRLRYVKREPPGES